MLSEKPIDSPRIAAKQIEELLKLWQQTSVRCHLPFGKTESPLCLLLGSYTAGMMISPSVARNAVRGYDELQRRLAGKPPNSSYDDVLRLLAKHCDIVDEIFTAPNGVVI
jgi:hypothetical protein